MSIDLDQLADQFVASQPTELPSLEAVRQRARQRDRRSLLVGVAVLLPLAGLAGFGLWAMLEDSGEIQLIAAPPAEVADPTPTPETSTVNSVTPLPALVGLTIADATELLDELDLAYAIVVEPSAGHTPGIVLRTDPVDGNPIDDGTIVTVIVTPSPVCGDTLPVSVGIAMQSTQGTSVSVSDRLELVNETVLESGETVVVRWPARERIAYELDDGIPLFFPARLETTGDSSVFTLTGLGKAEQQIGPEVEVSVPSEIESATSVAEGCEVVEIAITSGPESAIFGWDLPSSGWTPRDGATGFPLRNLAPLVTSTEQVDQQPSSTTGCPTNQEQGSTENRQLFGSPTDALAAFLETGPAETLIKSGFHEMIALNGSYTYGILSDVPTRTPVSTDDFVTIITVVEIEGAWQVVEWTASSC